MNTKYFTGLNSSMCSSSFSVRRAVYEDFGWVAPYNISSTLRPLIGLRGRFLRRLRVRKLGEACLNNIKLVNGLSYTIL